MYHAKEILEILSSSRMLAFQDGRFKITLSPGSHEYQYAYQAIMQSLMEDADCAVDNEANIIINDFWIILRNQA